MTRSCPRAQIGGLCAGEFPLVQSRWLRGSPHHLLLIVLAVKPEAMRIAKMFESPQVKVKVKVQVQVQDPVLGCEVSWGACPQLALVLWSQFPQ